MSEIPYIYDLKKLPTRVLMKYRDEALRMHSYLARMINDIRAARRQPPKSITRAFGYDPTGNGGSEILYADIIAELNTREHIPNKQEAKAIRKARKKAGRGNRPRGRR